MEWENSLLSSQKLIWPYSLPLLSEINVFRSNLFNVTLPTTLDIPDSPLDNTSESELCEQFLFPHTHCNNTFNSIF
jgi:hypothetical protein